MVSHIPAVIGILVAALTTGLSIAWVGMPTQPTRPAAEAPPSPLAPQGVDEAWEFALDAYRKGDAQRGWSHLVAAEELRLAEQASRDQPPREPAPSSRERVRFLLDGAEVAFFAREFAQGERWAGMGLGELPRIPWSVYYRDIERAIDEWMLRALIHANRAGAGQRDAVEHLEALSGDRAALSVDPLYFRGRLAEDAGDSALALASYERFVAGGLHRTFMRRAVWARNDSVRRMSALADSGSHG